MRIMVARSSASVAVVDSYRRALCDRLTDEGHQVEHLDLPSVGTDDRALANVVSYRLLGVATSASIVICLDAGASVIPHPRKLLWLLDDSCLDPDQVPTDDTRRRDLAYLANVLRSAVNEAGSIFSPSQFGVERLCRLGLSGATLFAPAVVQPPARYARNAGSELLVLAPLTDRQRPELFVSMLELLPEPFRARWVAPFAEQGWLARARSVAADRKLDMRLAFDVRSINEGEQSYLLAHAAALIDLTPAAPAIPDSVQSAIVHATPVIACTDGGATIDAATRNAEPVANDLASSVLAVCGPSAARPSDAVLHQTPPNDWQPLLKAILQ